MPTHDLDVGSWRSSTRQPQHYTKNKQFPLHRESIQTSLEEIAWAHTYNPNENESQDERNVKCFFN